MKNVPLKKTVVTILVLWALCIAVRLAFMQGFFLVADDDQYSQAAYEISQGNFPIPTNHWNARIGFTLSVAGFYRLFGVNEYSIIGASLVFSMLNILLLFLLSYEIFEENNWFIIGTISSILFIFVPLSIEMGTSVQVRHGQTFFMFLSIYLLLRGEKKGCLYSFISGSCVGIAYLFHETGVFIFLTIIGYFVVKKIFDKRILLFVCGFILVFACENITFYVKTGQLFYRQTIVLKSHFRIKEIDTASDIMKEKIVSDLKKKRTKLKPIENPFSGTFIGDSWLLEPFRQLLLNPTHSILYHLFFLTSIILLFKKDKKLLLLGILFWPLFLYFSYGPQSPFAYRPLRRLPWYALPCLIPVYLTVAYGIVCLLKRKYLQHMLILFFICISLLCTSIKGGDIGQRFYQSKFFYQFMQENPDQQFVTETITIMGFKFLSKYQPLMVEILIFPF